MTGDKKKKKDKAKLDLYAEIERIGKITQATTDAEEEKLRKLMKASRITKAPDPITPVGGGFYVPSSRNSTPKNPDPQEEFFVPITGTELMKKWSVGWEAIFDFARQDKLIPDEPKRFRTCIKYDFGMLSLHYTQQEREDYFSQWLYRPNDVEAFEAQHAKIIDAWREKVVSLQKDSTKISDAMKSEAERCYQIYSRLLKEGNLTHESWSEEIGKLNLELIVPGDIRGMNLYYGDGKDDKTNLKRNIKSNLIATVMNRIESTDRYTATMIQGILSKSS